MSDQASSAPSRRQFRSSLLGGLIFGLLAVVIVTATGMSVTLGLFLIAAGLFGPWLLIRRGSRVRKTSSDSPEPIQSSSAPVQSVALPHRASRFTLRNVGIVAVLLAALFQFLDRSDTERIARSAMESQLDEVTDKSWKITRASLPVFTLLEGKKNVDFILSNGDKVRRFSITIDGICFTGCTATWNKLQAFGM